MENEFIKRTFSGLVFAIVVLTSIWYGPISYFLLLGLIMILGLYEFSKMAVSDNLERFGIMYPISISIFMFGISSYLNIDPIFFKLLIYLLVFLVFILELKKQKPNPYKNLGNLYLAIIYISLPLTIATQIPNFGGEYHPEIIFSVFILIWANDSFAYIIGKRFGKRKLIERISPKKTIEGFIGGLVLTYAVGFVLAYFFNVFSLLEWFVITNIVGVFGVLGDLVESMFKRKVTIKDSGKFMPGHGGVLDRFDSFLFTSPFIYIFTQLIQL
jgi:phosphatidate cytidylyltransferase